jgi:hypothetical protein
MNHYPAHMHSKRVLQNNLDAELTRALELATPPAEECESMNSAVIGTLCVLSAILFILAGLPRLIL